MIYIGASSRSGQRSLNLLLVDHQAAAYDNDSVRQPVGYKSVSSNCYTPLRKTKPNPASLMYCGFASLDKQVMRHFLSSCLFQQAVICSAFNCACAAGTLFDKYIIDCGMKLMES